MIRSSTRLSRRTQSDIRAIRQATKRIQELSTILDGQMLGDDRPDEQLRHLRQATGQITRTANDAIHAYRRVSNALRAEGDLADADVDEIERTTQILASARAEMVNALEVAGRRYPWAEPFTGVAD